MTFARSDAGRKAGRHVAQRVLNPRMRREESGASLIFILVFISTVGMLGASLVSFQLTLNRQSFATRKSQTREFGANSGVEWAVNSLQQGRDSYCQGTLNTQVLTVGGREIEVFCRGADPAEDGVNSLALYLNRAEPAELNHVSTQGQFDKESKTIIGPMYNANYESGFALKQPLVVDGDVVVADKGGECRAGSATELPGEIFSLYRDAKSCSLDLSVVRPIEVPVPCETREKCQDPSPVLLDANGQETKSAPTCRVFSPGYYTSAPNLAADNYFKPGVYEFALKTPWRIASSLRGGDPAPDTATVTSDPRLSSAPKCTGAPEPVEPYGVVFVLGGSTQISVLSSARVELFGYTANNRTLPSIVSGGQKRVTEWAQPSQLKLDQDLLTVGGGEPEFIVHSGIFTPDSGMTMRGSGQAYEVIRNTTVVARLDLIADTPMKSDRIGISGRTGTVRRYLVMARSCSGDRDHLSHNACTEPPATALEPELCSSATITIYDDEKRTSYLDNWRVDRDPSRLDPSTCTFPP